jgi:hypothetical protein
MSIVEESSVLVIGAGVSAPFGVPMGGQMIPNIHRGIVSGRKHVDGEKGRFQYEVWEYIHTTFQSLGQFWEQPYWGIVLSRHFDERTRSIDEEGMNSDLAKLRKLTELLDGQTSETIDDFIVENPSYSEILKACIAVEIAKRTYTYNQTSRAIEPKALSARYLTIGERSYRNWIHLLINLVRQAIRTGQLKQSHKVRIISFNYDGILESVLAEQFQNTGRNYPSYQDCFDIVHPHGLCGKLNQAPIKSPNELFDWSQNICVVNEEDIANQFVIQERQKAKNWIQNASQVYAVGFAFAAPNCELLGLRTSPPGSARHLHYCNFDGNEGVRLSAEKCKLFKYKHPTDGTFDRPVSVENWLYAGYLGEFSA